MNNFSKHYLINHLIIYTFCCLILSACSNQETSPNPTPLESRTAAVNTTSDNGFYIEYIAEGSNLLKSSFEFDGQKWIFTDLMEEENVLFTGEMRDTLPATLTINDTTKYYGWEAALALMKANPAIVYAEPLDLEREFRDSFPVPLEFQVKAFREKEVLQQGCHDRWPNCNQDTLSTYFAWHLDSSQLKQARDSIKLWGDHEKKVKVAIFDSGFYLNHDFAPSEGRIRKKRNTILWQGKNDITDRSDNAGFAHEINYGHGTGTLALLAGEQGTFPDGSVDYFGGNPYCDLYLYRMSNGSPVLKLGALRRALYEAVDIDKVDVISMSLGGIGTRALKRALRNAHEKGVVVVAAAGNNFRGNGCGKPSRLRWAASNKVVFPANQPSTICVTGVTAIEEPYAFKYNPKPTGEDCKHELEHMQISYEKEFNPDNTIAAYSPNISWAKINAQDSFRYSGGGTSAPVPQVAAAIALWIQRHRTAYDNIAPNKRVDLIKRILFETAKAPKLAEYKTYIGNHGILRAYDFLQVGPDDINSTQPILKDIEPNEILAGANVDFVSNSMDYYMMLGAFETDPRDSIGTYDLQGIAAINAGNGIIGKDGILEESTFLGSKIVNSTLPDSLKVFYMETLGL